MKQIIFVILALIIGNVISQYFLDNLFEKLILDFQIELKYGQKLLDALIYVIIPFVIGGIVETGIILYFKGMFK